MRGRFSSTSQMRSLWGNAAGSVAVEFSIILPVMLVMFFGTFEVTQLVRAYLSANKAAQTFANLVAQEGVTGYSTSESTDFCTAAKYVMAPMAGSGLTATVASVTRNIKTGVVAFDWQDTTCGGGAGTFSDATTASSTLIPNNGDSVIIVKVTYNYKAAVHFVLPSTFTINQTAYQRQRTGNNTPQS